MSTDTIPLSIPDLRGNEAAYLAECVADNWVSSAGPFVTEMERRMAATVGRAHGVALVNGTAALELALRAIGIGQEPRNQTMVALPAYTFAASANAVIHAGATPVFLDVTEESWTLDPALLDEALNPTRLPIKAVLAVDVLGHPADYDTLQPLCDRAGVPLIADAAGAIGGVYLGKDGEKPCGAFGTAATFSFNGNKTVTAGGGGMLMTDDTDLAARARHLSTQARLGGGYEHDEIGFNYRMTNVNAAIGLAQLERLDEMLAARRLIARSYAEAVAERDDIAFMPEASWARSGCWLSNVLLAERVDAESLAAHLNAAGIQARPFWRSLAPQAPWRDASTFLNGVAERLTGRVVSLPSSSNLTDADLARVLAALGQWRGAPLHRKVA